MAKEIHWTKTLYARFGGLIAALLAVVAVLMAANLYYLSTVKGIAASMNLSGLGRMRMYQILFIASRLPDAKGEEQATLAGELRNSIALMDERFGKLRSGDVTQGVPPETDPRVLKEIDQREQLWRSKIRPRIERLAVAPTGKGREEMKILKSDIESYISEVDAGVALFQTVSEEKVTSFRSFQYVFILVVIAALVIVFWIARGAAMRTRDLATTADKIAGGDMAATAPVSGSDELAVLGESFNTMTASLRSMISAEKDARAATEKLLVAVTEAANQLAASAVEILAATTQQAAGATEQASSVAEAVTTVDEVAQTADQAAQRAKAVAESSQRAAEVARTGRKAVEDTVAATGTVREKSESVSASILALAERTHAIGEIASAVGDMADQVNLLALNASIEAARAGEQGRGFAVVAGEVKVLADQAKKATVQVRQILGEVQKATNSAVMAAEEGTRVVGGAMKAAGQAGETIRSLSETISEAATAASQIVASASQQAAGMTQIHQAMRNIGQATTQNLASTRQAERAAQDLNALGTRLKDLLAGYGR